MEFELNKKKEDTEEKWRQMKGVPMNAIVHTHTHTHPEVPAGDSLIDL